MTRATRAELLGQDVRNQSDDAFGEVVRQHLDLVYSAALRHWSLAIFAPPWCPLLPSFIGNFVESLVNPGTPCSLITSFRHLPAEGASHPRGSHSGKRAFEPNHRHGKQILKVRAISRSTKFPTKFPTKGPRQVWARHQNGQTPERASVKPAHSGFTSDNLWMRLGQTCARGNGCVSLWNPRKKTSLLSRRDFVKTTALATGTVALSAKS